MSGLDIFAWIVLIILVTSVVAVFCIAGWLPGHIAKSRSLRHAQAVTVAGHIVRRVILRQVAILNYVNPF